jgi:hypothetical protein
MQKLLTNDHFYNLHSDSLGFGVQIKDFDKIISKSKLKLLFQFTIPSSIAKCDDNLIIYEVFHSGD